MSGWFTFAIVLSLFFGWGFLLLFGALFVFAAYDVLFNGKYPLIKKNREKSNGAQGTSK